MTCCRPCNSLFGFDTARGRGRSSESSRGDCLAITQPRFHRRVFSKDMKLRGVHYILALYPAELTKNPTSYVLPVFHLSGMAFAIRTGDLRLVRGKASNSASACLKSEDDTWRIRRSLNPE